MCYPVSTEDIPLQLFNGDSLEVLKSFPDNSIDSVVCDPPYGLSFMGKNWDKALPPTEIWEECIRVLKPGGYLVAMSASRTYHRLAVQLEDLGLICHPMIGWIYGSGFPKATDLSKQFDKQAGAEREVVGERKHPTLKNKPNKKSNAYHVETLNSDTDMESWNITAPSTDLAKKWDGYKYGLQALKPALEPIAVFQKPWKCKDVKRMTDNVKNWGVGAFNIDACRVGVAEKEKKSFEKEWDRNQSMAAQEGRNAMSGGPMAKDLNEYRPQGRHPANLLHDGSEVVEEVFLKQGGQRPTGDLTGQPRIDNANGIYNTAGATIGSPRFHKGDTGTASRFFNSLPITDLDAPFLYQAKASKRERNEGLEGMEEKESGAYGEFAGDGRGRQTEHQPRANHHPTVKPIKLMEWLIKLVTPAGGTTLDPFMGSGSTGIAAVKNDFNFVGIELNEEYFEIAKRRIQKNQ